MLYLFLVPNTKSHMASYHYSHKPIQIQKEEAHTQCLHGRNVKVKMQEEYVE